MKHRLLCVFGALTVLTAVRAVDLAPDSPAGCVFYESGSNIAHIASTTAVILDGDGTLHGLFYIASQSGGLPNLSNRSDGVWSYRKIDSMTAALTFTTGPSGDQHVDSRVLTFTSGTAGHAGSYDPPAIVGGSVGGPFRLVSQAVRSPLSNCSNRSVVSSGGSAFAGFVVTDSAPRAVLIRAVGPGLGQFGLTGFLKTPKLSVVAAADNRVVASNSGWTSTTGGLNGTVAIRQTSALVGAFALPEGSHDSATIVNLSAGAYIAQVSSDDSNDSGQALIEIYILP